MNRMDLYEAIGQADDQALARSEKKSSHKFRWTAAIAAMLAVVFAVGLLVRPGGGPVACAVRTAEYPEMAPYPNDETDEAAVDKWYNSRQALAPEDPDFAEDLRPFFTAAVDAMLSDSEETNPVCSPVNFYMALGMLAELSGGESRRQILDLLGSDSVEALRAQAQIVWEATYQNDGATTVIPASALWMNQEVSFLPETLDTLADAYYASTFQGEMGSPELNNALQTWLNEQTGGLLEEQISEETLDPRTVLALTASLYYRAKWGFAFDPAETRPGTFHAPGGDIEQDFMHQQDTCDYWWFDQFSAIQKPLDNDGGSMWLLLPDEGVSPEELLKDPIVMEFATAPWETRMDCWGDAHSKYLIVNLALPKFDVSGTMDLKASMESLGVTQVFDPEHADFSPTTDEKSVQPLYLSQATHTVRVAADEEGITAAAYTKMALEGAGEPPTEEVDFTLDRPFLFVLTSSWGIPLFAGIVNEP